MDGMFAQMQQIAEEDDPAFKDVWIGHEYRDGSAKRMQDFEKAVEHYSKAARAGSAEGLYNLALMTMRGLGVTRDMKKGMELLQEAANKSPVNENGIPVVGVAEAEHSIGLAFQEGYAYYGGSATQSDSMASYWYERAVEHGNPQAANNLGVLYNKGKGVKKDPRRAEELLLFAHHQGIFTAASNLVLVYIELNDPDQALVWHERALEKGCSYALTHDTAIRAELERLKQMKSIVEDSDFPFFKDVVELVKRARAPADPRGDVSFDPEMLKRKWKEGSATAGELLRAMGHFYTAMELFQSGLKKDTIYSFVDHLGKAFEIESMVCQYLPDTLQQVTNALQKIIGSQGKEKSVLNQKVRLCLAYLKATVDMPMTINILTDLIRSYPENWKARRFRGCMYAFAQEWEKSLNDFDHCLKLSPDDVQPLYYRASALKMLDRADEAIAGFEQFLKKAPSDNRVVPKCYYSMAFIEFSRISDSGSDPFLSKKWISLFQKGEESEKEQLPCFLPVQSQEKTWLLLLFQANEGGFQKKPEKVPVSSLPDYLSSSERASILRDHRTYIKAVRENLASGQIRFPFTTTPSKRQGITPSLRELKSINIRDLDFAKDKIWKGHVLTVTIFDIHYFSGSSYGFVVEDAKHVLQRLAIYNLQMDSQEVERKYPPGMEISIINPYARIAADGKPLIRVDDPRSVVTNKLKQNMCRYCGKEGAPSSCAKCKVAHFCSKECQTRDWPLHKLICTK